MIRARLQSDVVLVRRVAEYIIQGGGMLAPRARAAAAGALGYREAHHHDLAAVVEFIHTRNIAS